MSPRILLVPVEPVPTPSLVEALAERIAAVLSGEVRTVEPLVPPASSRTDDDLLDLQAVCSALGATWGCGCRTRIVGVTRARLRGGSMVAGYGCGSPLLVSLGPGTIGESVRAIAATLGLASCDQPDCAMHPGAETQRLCPGCRSRL
ncbi:MAG TPA: hypothetical protein PK089_05110 [Methanoregulaceae archaeon]|nr:hypothetical protein [Methanoregulaceae archaeon]HQJ87104.1 hypothetical protein [Methanoregulaceae archaeon]